MERQPLTGVVIAPRPALVVKVDNVDAEPQSGLNQADIVFEEIVEGQATRFAAVFNSMEANPVGPIRSGRTQDVNLLLSLNDPAIVYSGANEASTTPCRPPGSSCSAKEHRDSSAATIGRRPTTSTPTSPRCGRSWSARATPCPPSSTSHPARRSPAHR